MIGLKTLVWFWLIDETLGLTFELSVARAKVYLAKWWSKMESMEMVMDIR